MFHCDARCTEYLVCVCLNVCCRRDCIGSDAEVAVGGMMCDESQFRMMRSFADTEAARAPVWAEEIEQDVMYVQAV